jgi:hypothetical protein
MQTLTQGHFACAQQCKIPTFCVAKWWGPECPCTEEQETNKRTFHICGVEDQSRWAELGRTGRLGRIGHDWIRWRAASRTTAGFSSCCTLAPQNRVIASWNTLHDTLAVVSFLIALQSAQDFCLSRSWRSPRWKPSDGLLISKKTNKVLRQCLPIRFDTWIYLWPQ